MGSPPRSGAQDLEPDTEPGLLVAEPRRGILARGRRRLVEMLLNRTRMPGMAQDDLAHEVGDADGATGEPDSDVGGPLVDVIDAAGEIDWQPPDTGSLRGDLTVLNQEIQESLVVQPSFAVALMAASFHSERAARAQTRLWADRYAQCGILVERGELPARHTDARSLLIAATAPLYHQLVLLRADPDPRLPERAARAAVLAAAAGAFSVPRQESA
nr:TetR-like C-terminal domain-containing protein [Streptomyces sp. 13-12-16]